MVRAGVRKYQTVTFVATTMVGKLFVTLYSVSSSEKLTTSLLFWMPFQLNCDDLENVNEGTV